MRSRIGIALAAAAGVAVALVLLFGDEDEAAPREPVPGQPSVEVLTPRNGSRHDNHAIAVRVEVRNFDLAPESFGEPPELGQGHIRFSLNKVPTEIADELREQAASNPLGRGRAVGKSFDFPRYSGPNGALAERIGSAGVYSPATMPEIYYENLPTGTYRLVITLARNDGTATPFHATTHFQIVDEDADAEVPTGG